MANLSTSTSMKIQFIMLVLLSTIIKKKPIAKNTIMYFNVSNLITPPSGTILMGNSARFTINNRMVQREAVVSCHLLILRDNIGVTYINMKASLKFPPLFFKREAFSHLRPKKHSSLGNIFSLSIQID